jgi:outer membrane protein assembly factor BamB
VWKTPIPGVGASSPVVWDRHIFLLTAAKDGKERALVCLDAQNGKIRWQRKFPGVHVKVRGESSLASATPACDSEAVYVPVWDGNAVHFVAYTFDGELMWQKTLGRWVSQHGTGSSPVIVGDKVIFAFDMDAKDAKENPTERPATLMAFNKKTGDLAWETPRPAYRASYSAPFVLERNGHSELIVTSTLSIAAYNPETGKQLWNWDWGWDKFKSKWPLRTVASSVVVGDTLFATSGDGGGDRRIVALTLPKNGGAPVYAWGDGNKLFPYVPTPLARGAHVYFVNDRGFAGCYEAKTGKQVFYERIDGATFLSSPVLVDGLIYAPSHEGDVHVFAAEPVFKHLAKNALGERFRASPAVADGRLYIRGESHLFCIGNPK